MSQSVLKLPWTSLYVGLGPQCFLNLKMAQLILSVGRKMQMAVRAREVQITMRELVGVGEMWDYLRNRQITKLPAARRKGLQSRRSMVYLERVWEIMFGILQCLRYMYFQRKQKEKIPMIARGITRGTNPPKNRASQIVFTTQTHLKAIFPSDPQQASLTYFWMYTLSLLLILHLLNLWIGLNPSMNRTVRWGTNMLMIMMVTMFSASPSIEVLLTMMLENITMMPEFMNWRMERVAAIEIVYSVTVSSLYRLVMSSRTSERMKLMIVTPREKHILIRRVQVELTSLDSITFKTT